VDSGSQPPKSGIAAFLSTTLGKLVVGGVILVMLAGVLGVIATTFLFTAGDDLAGVVVPPPGSAVATDAAGAAVPTERRPPRLDYHFAFRNIFRPTVRPTPPEPESTDASGTPDIPADTLFLQSVSTDDGVAKGEFIWNGATYTAAAGEVLGDTPWKVISINGDTVVMLYGDSRVTLVVGQATSK
jgi:hypothetical protein